MVDTAVSAGAAQRSPLVSMVGLTKRFGATTANQQVDLEVFPGEVLALLGENGAGKSTLMHLLYGLYPPDGGHISVDGREIHFASPRDAMAAGIGMVFQQFSLLPNLSVLENLLVAWPDAPWWQGRARSIMGEVLVWLRKLAPSLDPARRVSDLAVGERQVVELAKVLNLNPRIVILDEPTSVLTPDETARLHGFVRNLAAAGKAVIFITHKIGDVTACADRVAIMRHGRLVEQGASSSKSSDQIVRAMVGQTVLSRVGPAAPNSPIPRLQLFKLSTSPNDSNCPVDALTLTVGGGEIVGVAGVIGNGQTALAEAIAGLMPVLAGEITLDGVSLARLGNGLPPATPALAYVPERPIDNAVVADLDLATNLDLRLLRGQPFFSANLDRAGRAAALINDYDVRPRNPGLAARSLSGGNLQKLVTARELSGSPNLVVACYPTMGLDLTAADAVRQRMFEHAARGSAVLWISEDLDDLLQYAHRIAVLFNGRLMGIVPRDGASRDRIGRLMAGMGDEPRVA
jgi:general nucleoside transport system ATP-binding protein